MKTFKVNYITNPEFGRTDNGNPGPLEKEAANKVRQNILANIAAFNQKKLSREIGPQILPPELFTNTGAILRPNTKIELFDIDNDALTVSIMAKMLLSGFQHLKYGFKCGFTKK